MKKYLFIFLSLLFAGTMYAQIESGNIFPRIGFGDLYWIDLRNYGEDPVDYSDSNYYYPRLEELGLTHTITFADNVSLNNGVGIGIIDNNFGDGSTIYRKYALSNGNTPNFYPYQIGGSGYANAWSTNENFSFGNQEKYSGWMKGTDLSSTKMNYTDGSRKVFFAEKNVDSEGLMIVRLVPDPQHTKNWGQSVAPPYEDIEYKLLIRAKVADYSGLAPTTNIARVEIQDSSWITGITPISRGGYDIKLSDFNSSTGYVDIIKGPFDHDNSNNYQFDIKIYWTGAASLYIDLMCVFDEHYEELFPMDGSNPTALKNQIKSALDSDYSSTSSHTNFEHFYFDEPGYMMYRSIEEVSNLAVSELGAGKYVNGSTKPLENYRALYINNHRRMPYIMYNNYTIKPNIDTVSTGTSTNIQTAYDNFINKDHGWNKDGNPVYSGLRTAIKMAQNYTLSTADDVRLISGIQVQADGTVLNGDIDDLWNRMPTPNEILCQGHLSLCYGAKGIMYYLIFTKPANVVNNGQLASYGLFDDVSSHYEGGTESTDPGVTQTPANAQEPNDRFYAVKALNQYIDNINSTLLNLVWQNSYSMHKVSSAGYFESVRAFDGANEDDTSYVEVGFFDNPSDASDDGYFYVVNRRTLSTEDRTIRLTINRYPEKPQYETVAWDIEEIGTQNTWNVAEDGVLSVNFEPGEGKLFRIEEGSIIEFASLDKDGTQEEIPTEYGLKGNYPNPFNPSTEISFALPYKSQVNITVYDITGRKVTELINGEVNAGYRNVTWNGTNQAGQQVASGIYLYTIKAVSLENNEDFVKSAKMMMIK